MAQCITPFVVKDKKTKESIPVPCGKCPYCLKRRVSAWSFRLMQHDKAAKVAHFVTLTYSTEQVPITENGFMTLSKRDCQLFMKRLRKANPGEKISYYLAGEYGGKTMRPHYHIILFNADLPTINVAWQLGHIHYGTVAAASVGYTLKYICKPGKIPLHRNDDRQPEFALMSKGIGANYLTKSMVKWHHANVTERMYCTTSDNKKIAMPRYYKQKIYSDQQRKAISVYSQKQNEILILEEMAKYGDKYFREKLEQHKADFARAKYHATLGRDKI